MPIGQNIPLDGQIFEVEPPELVGEKVSVIFFDQTKIHLSGQKYDHGFHFHRQGQFYYLSEGYVRILCQNNLLSPPHKQVVWIPPGVAHQTQNYNDANGWTVFVDQYVSQLLPQEPIILENNLLITLILKRLAKWKHKVYDSAHERLAMVLLDELIAARRIFITLSFPKDKKLLKLAEDILSFPGDKRSLKQIARENGFSSRNLSRKFSQETGLSLSAWRCLAKMVRSRELLATEFSVKEVAFSLGYENVSSFIDIFKKTFGHTPGSCREH
jgi:AraC-like DNA-binding protein